MSSSTSSGNNKSGGDSKSKASPVLLSEEERTPKLLKSLEPDLTVVVGGVEFHHYQSILCAACPLIDTMLASNMKESKERRIEFPDKDPDLWLGVYSCFKFMDPSTKDEDFEAIFRQIFFGSDDDLWIYQKTCRKLVSWFDFLGMQPLVRRMDKLAAKKVVECYNENGAYLRYPSWCLWKYVPAPLTQKAMKNIMKNELVLYAYHLSRRSDVSMTEEAQEDYNGYLLDDQCGDEMWSDLLSKVDFPESMLEKSRKAIVESPFFPAMLELAGRTMEKKPANKVKFSFKK